MRRVNSFVLAVCLAVNVTAAAAAGAGPAGAPTTRPTSSVRGTVIAESEVPLSEMVVYLESPDASRPAPPATQPVSLSQKGAQFEPRLVVVTVGQTVNFLN